MKRSSDQINTPTEEASGKRAGVDFGVGMNPEFLRKREAIHDFTNPSRIVLESIDERNFDVMARLSEAFPDVEVIRTNPRTAEMTKYTANALFATMISFSNEIRDLCAAVPGVDVTEVMRGVHSGKRLSPIFPDGARMPPSFTSNPEAA